MSLQGKTLENSVERRKNTGIQHFLLFPQYFLPFHRHNLPFLTFNLSSAKAFNLDKSYSLQYKSYCLSHNSFTTVLSQVLMSL